MCGVFGVISRTPGKRVSLDLALKANSARGRDAVGVWTPFSGGHRALGSLNDNPGFLDLTTPNTAIGNLRAEPTTEWVREKQLSDVQPYEDGQWVIVHNGTIANDKELIAEHGLNPPTQIDSWVIAAMIDRYGFQDGVRKLVGSFAILAIDKLDPGRIWYAMNYRPLYKHINDDSIILSSVPIDEANDVLLEPYSFGVADVGIFGEPVIAGLSLRNNVLTRAPRALVVFSGGLDSTVAASALQYEGYDVELLHFDYGARATKPERQAVEAVAEYLNVPLHIVQTDIFTATIRGSRLTNTKEAFAEGEAGAEYAHEWVPARNLILTSVALGMAESRKFDVLALGANLEEAGAYPDNEPEFLRQFQKIIPFAVGDGVDVRIVTPVGNLMKHEIVKLGLNVGAPMHLSWSCYDARVEYVPGPELMADGEKTVYKHCGRCGPCFMRRTAFEINGAEDPVFASEEVPSS